MFRSADFISKAVLNFFHLIGQAPKSVLVKKNLKIFSGFRDIDILIQRSQILCSEITKNYKSFFFKYLNFTR